MAGKGRSGWLVRVHGVNYPCPSEQAARYLIRKASEMGILKVQLMYDGIQYPRPRSTVVARSMLDNGRSAR